MSRSGAGPERARAAATAVAKSATGIGIAGVAGGLTAGLRPGCVVVADRVLSADGSVLRDLPSAPLIAAELAARGVQAVVGAIISTPRVVHGTAARAALAATGAIAVDTETAFMLERLPDSPAAVIRTIADTPERELRSLSTVPGGWRALRSLTAVAPVLELWAASIFERTALMAGPRSFCAGVERAIATVDRALDRFGTPVYVRRQIVHNQHVVTDLQERGAIFVEELHQVPDGATVVFSAHGVAPKVRQEAEARGLHVVDATCPLVAKVHHEVHRFTQRGYQVVLIGHAGHDETEGTLGEAEDVTLIETADDVAGLHVKDPEKIAYITQTTLAPSDVADVVDRLAGRFPALTGPNAADICYATQNRQEAVSAMAGDCDLILVVGSRNSSNAARLVEVAAKSGRPAHLVEDETGVRLGWLRHARSVGITAAASTPPHLVEQVTRAIGGLGRMHIQERSLRHENVSFPLPVEVR